MVPCMVHLMAMYYLSLLMVIAKKHILTSNYAAFFTAHKSVVTPFALARALPLPGAAFPSTPSTSCVGLALVLMPADNLL